MDLGGAVAFLPGSQVDIRPRARCRPADGQPAAIQILKMDRPLRQYRGLTPGGFEETRAEQRSELVAGLKEGQVLQGVVKNITDYGAFVDLGGVDGFVARHGYFVEARQPSVGSFDDWSNRDGSSHPLQLRDAAYQLGHEAA